VGKHVTITGDVRSFESIMRIIPTDKWHFSAGMRFPIVECPNCGDGMLGDPAPHGIKESGEVYKSVVCQNENCNFHNHIILEGWNHGEIAHR